MGGSWQHRGMRLTLEIDLDAPGDDAAKEAGRILRYWAGALGQLDLAAPLRHDLMDSGYRPVGAIAVEPSGGEPLKATLHRYLRRMHQALLWKIDGLGERDARWPMTPTGTNLLGLLKHVASIESGYLGEVFGRPFPEEHPWLADDAEANADMWAGPEESVASVRAFAERVWAHIDATIETLPLDAPGVVPWWSEERREVTLGRVLVHVIDDVSRHAGQADILRELVDGESGLVPGNENLALGDAAWWSDYVARLQQVATTAAEDATQTPDA